MAIYRGMLYGMVYLMIHLMVINCSIEVSPMLPHSQYNPTSCNVHKCVHHEDKSSACQMMYSSDNSCVFRVTTNNRLVFNIDGVAKQSSQGTYFQIFGGEDVDGIMYSLSGLRNLPCKISVNNSLLLLRMIGIMSVQVTERMLTVTTNSVNECKGNICNATERLPRLYTCAGTDSKDNNLMDFVVCEARPFDNEFWGHVVNKAFCNVQCPENCSSVIDKNGLKCLCRDSTQNKKVMIFYSDSFSVLDLSHNNISHIDSAALEGSIGKDVEWLDISHNNLHSFQLNALGNLEILNISHNELNNISNVSFAQLEYLGLLDLSYNSIQQIEMGSFESLDMLAILDLMGNDITNLYSEFLRGLLDIMTIDLSHNTLLDIDDNAFRGCCKHLQKLYLGSNDITSIQNGTFKQLNSLEYLDLGDNNIQTMTKNSFTGLHSLLILHLNNNGLIRIEDRSFATLPNLHELSLSRNRLTNLYGESFQGLTNLKWLDISWNKLSDLSNDSFSGLEYLDLLYLHSNDLTTFPRGLFRAQSKLIRLQLANNILTSLDEGIFASLSSLTVLDLDRNGLHVVDYTILKGLESLERLQLHYNLLQIIRSDTFSDCTALTRIDLSHNDISIIEEFSFDRNIHILNLTLNDNNIKHLPHALFIHTTNMVRLNLSNNNLETLPDLDPLSNLQLLDITQNQLKRVPSANLHNSTVFVDEFALCCFLTCKNCHSTEPRPSYLTCQRLMQNNYLRIMMWLLGILAIIGNVGVLVWRYCGQSEENEVQSLLICHLAAADFLMGVYMLIIAAADQVFGTYFPLFATKWRYSWVCRLAGILAITSSESSIFFITLISIDRLIRISYSSLAQRLCLKSMRVIGVLIWAVAFTLSIIPNVQPNNSDTNFYETSEVCIGLPFIRKSILQVEQIERTGVEWYKPKQQFETSKQIGTASGSFYSIAVFLGLNLLCFIVISCCYLSIFHTVWTSATRVKRSSGYKREIRIAFRMGLIVGTDLACWLPTILIGILVQFGAVTIPPNALAWIVAFILPINSSINPYLYTLVAAIGKVRAKINTANAESVLLPPRRRNYVSGGREESKTTRVDESVQDQHNPRQKESIL